MQRPFDRTRDAPGVAAGITEAMIAALVPAFYARVREDPDLGPIFERAISDWPSHLAKLVDFWSSVTLMTGRFKGAPMAAHMGLGGLEGRHFTRWLALWREAVSDHCPAPAASLFLAKAEMIARSLQLGLGAANAASRASSLRPPDRFGDPV